MAEPKKTDLEAAPREKAVDGAPRKKATDAAKEVGPGPLDNVDDQEVICPSCHRFSGTYEKCPYCGARVYKRMSVRFFRWGSIVVAVVGLLILWNAARLMKAPKVRVKDIIRTMSMARIKVQGVIAQPVRFNTEFNSTFFSIEDEGAKIFISAYGETAEQLIAEHKPEMGDLVEAVGMVRVTQGRPPKLVVAAPYHFKVLKASGRDRALPGVAPIAEVTEEAARRQAKMTLVGRLEGCKVLKAGFRANLVDGTGSIIVWIYRKNYDRMPERIRSLLQDGKIVRIAGRTKAFENPGTGRVDLEIIPFQQPGTITAARDSEIQGGAPGKGR